MARRRRINIRQENKRGVIFIAFVLWVIGFADLVLGIIQLPSPYAVWALVLSGAILLISSIVEGL